jgi:hypothetical protein
MPGERWSRVAGLWVRLRVDAVGLEFVFEVEIIGFGGSAVYLDALARARCRALARATGSAVKWSSYCESPTPIWG